MSRASSSTLRRIMPNCRRSSGSMPGSCSRAAADMSTGVRGVRNSCERAAKKSSFARLARSAGELFFRVTDHVTERGIYPGVSAIEPYHCHADRCFLEYLPEILLARLERSSVVGNETHFTDTAQTRDHQEDVFEDDPAGMLD